MLQVHELFELRYAVEADQPTGPAAKAVLQAEAAHHLAAAEHEIGRVTNDPNERERNKAVAGLHRAMADFCGVCAAAQPRPKPQYADSSTGPGGESALPPVGDAKVKAPAEV